MSKWSGLGSCGERETAKEMLSSGGCLGFGCVVVVVGDVVIDVTVVMVVVVVYTASNGRLAER